MKLRYHIHLSGFLFILLTIFVGLAAAQRPNNLIVWGFGVLLAMILVSGVVGSSMMRGLKVRRLDIRRASAGEPLEIRYVVENRSRWRSAFAMHVQEVDRRGKRTSFPMLVQPSDGWLTRVGPGESQICDAVFWPSQRGVLALQCIRLSTQFPFGFNDRSVDHAHPHEILVQPRIHPVRGELMQSIATGELGGFGVSRQPGPGEDFYSVREFKPGDSIRQIAWKRSGISDELLVIQRSVSAPPRLRIVLNLSASPSSLKFDENCGVSAEELEERAITMAASLAGAAEQHGLEFGLSVLGFDTPSIPLRRGYWHRERVLTSLAMIELDSPRQQSEGNEPGEEERSSLVVVHPARIDPRCAPEHALHWSATRFEQLLDLEIGTAQEHDESIRQRTKEGMFA
ncbi:MAG: DUF58 domain-containing protein [Planctomycetota bacterium]|nr:DUF58 domain-containing protein [Planctomycetota bacterium]